MGAEWNTSQSQPHKLWDQQLCSYFTDEQPEVQRNSMICPKSYKFWRATASKHKSSHIEGPVCSVTQQPSPAVAGWPNVGADSAAHWESEGWAALVWVSWRLLKFQHEATLPEVLVGWNHTSKIQNFQKSCGRSQLETKPYSQACCPIRKAFQALNCQAP